MSSLFPVRAARDTVAPDANLTEGGVHDCSRALAAL
jgi:hypothetical protein